MLGCKAQARHWLALGTLQPSPHQVVQAEDVCVSSKEGTPSAQAAALLSTKNQDPRHRPRSPTAQRPGETFCSQGSRQAAVGQPCQRAPEAVHAVVEGQALELDRPGSNPASVSFLICE